MRLECKKLRTPLCQRLVLGWSWLGTLRGLESGHPRLRTICYHLLVARNHPYEKTNLLSVGVCVFTWCAYSNTSEVSVH